MIGFALNAIALMLTATSGLQLGDSIGPESVFDAAWNQPAPPMKKRAMIGRWRAPAFGELHKFILSHAANSSDRTHEATMFSTFEQTGVFKAPYTYRRVTCRSGLCEYVIIYHVKSNTQQRTVAADGLTKATRLLCRSESCFDAILLSWGSSRDDDKAILGYFVPKKSVFLGYPS